MYNCSLKNENHAGENPLRGFALRTKWEVFGKLTVSKTIFRKKKKSKKIVVFNRFFSVFLPKTAVF